MIRNFIFDHGIITSRREDDLSMYITCQISRKICTVLTDNHIISPEENKFYLYCFDFVLDNILFNASIFLIGVLLNVPLQSALYLITMIPVKMFAGGAHASSRMKCSMVSFSVFLMILFLTGQFAATTPQGMIHLIFFLSIFLILYMAPVGTVTLVQFKQAPENRRSEVCF